jgi:hypothetical protein
LPEHGLPHVLRIHCYMIFAAVYKNVAFDLFVV